MFRKFEPIAPTAKSTVEFILGRGGQIVQDCKTHVVIERLNQQATVDQLGRVSWQEKLSR
jgi:hypothetical protein